MAAIWPTIFIEGAPPMTSEPKRTYHEQAVQDAGEASGGRFARNTEISIAGTSAIPHADKLAAPRWSHDCVPPEEPLGYAIDELPDQTTVSGIARELLAPVPDTPTEEE
jgi:hypothetical protein